MKTITIKTAQSKFGKLVKLSDLKETLAKNYNDFNEALGSEHDFLINETNYQFDPNETSDELVTFTKNGNTFEGYVSHYSYEPHKKTFWVYPVIVARPTKVEYDEEILSIEDVERFFKEVQTIKVHRKEVKTVDSKVLSRPNTKKIDAYIKTLSNLNDEK